MRLACRLIAAPHRFAARLWLASKFWLRLNYRWNVAWDKAERN